MASRIAVPEVGTVRTDDDHTISYASYGDAFETVVLVHGITLDRSIWDQQVCDLLDAGFRVVTIDQRGHGSSSPLSAAVDPARLGSDLACVLDALDLHDVTLVGHSLGGIAAIAFVVGHPEKAEERLHALVLLSTTGTARFASHVTSMHAIVAPIERLAYMAVPRWIPTPVRMAVRPKSIGRGVLRFAFGRKPDREDVAVTEHMFSHTAHATVRHLFEGLLDWHMLEDLDEVDVPTLIVCGSRDLVTPMPLSRHLQAHIHGSELFVVPGAGHMLMMERPALLSDLLVDFARCDAPAAVTDLPKHVAADAG